MINEQRPLQKPSEYRKEEHWKACLLFHFPQVLQKMCDNRKTAQSLKCIIKTLMFSPYGSLLSLFFAGEDIKVFLTWHGANTNDQTLHQSIQGEGGAEDGHALGDVLPHLLLQEAQSRSTSQWHLNNHPSYESTGFISVTV